MTSTLCPADTQLIRFADRDLSQEEGEVVAEHLSECSCCRERAGALRLTASDIRAPVVPDFDLKAHVDGVMDRLQETPRIPKRWLRNTAWPALAGSLAAGVLICVGYFGLGNTTAGTWQARGGNSAVATIARDVGVQTYASADGLRPLTPGTVIGANTPLTAGFRNLGASPVYLLLFAVDENKQVHWISPSYTREGQDPAATLLPVSRDERLLPNTVVFDDLARGPLRIVTVISANPLRVSMIESMGSDLSSPTITRSIPQAEVRELRIEVREGGLLP